MLEANKEPLVPSGIGWIVDDLPVAVCVVAVPAGHLIYANRAFRLLVRMRSDGLGSEPGQRGEPCRAVQLALARVQETRQAVTLERVPLGDGELGNVEVRVSAHPILDAARRMTHVRIALLGAAPSALETARAATQARLELMLDHAPIVSWAADTHGVITVSRGGGLEALGVRSGELVGRSVFELYRDHPAILEHIRRALAGESCEFTDELQGAVYDTWLMPVRNAAQDVIGVAGLSNDRREIRRLQTLSIQNDRVMALGTLAASVAHEINNPLTYILVHAEQIRKALGKLDAITAQLEGSPALELEVWLGKLREHFGTMKSGTERIAAITRELRSFSRPDDNSLEAIDLRGVVRSVLQLIGKKLENVARLSLDLQETALVQGNRARFVQVVFNLVVNAMQALPRGGHAQHQIAIRCFSAQGRAILEVSDTGPGVPAADRERIFDPFVTTKGGGEGTGLGLFVCRNILSVYAGTLSVADREGGGALFRVSLPVAAGAVAAPVAVQDAVSTLAPAGNPRQRVRHVLVIDDEPLVARALCARLRRAGYRASRETDGRSGLRRLLGADDVDLVFCDLLMSDMNGTDLLAELKLRAPDKLAKMVFMTGSAFSDSARQIELEEGRVIEKPFDIVKEAERWLCSRSRD